MDFKFATLVQKHSLMVLVTTLLFTNLSASAQLSQSNAIGTNAISASQANTSSSPSEADLLKEQIKTMQYYEGRLLSNIHWTLGVVVTLGLLLVGYQWISANKLYERDKDVLRKGIVAEMEDRQSKLGTELQKTIQDVLTATAARFIDLDREMTAKHTVFTQEVLGLVNNQAQNLTRLEGKLTESLSTIRLSLEEETRKLIAQSAKEVSLSFENSMKEKVDKITSTQSEIVAQINSAVSTIGLQLNVGRHDIKVLEAQAAEAQGVYGNAYRFYSQALERAVEIKWDFLQASRLDDALRMAQKLPEIFNSDVQAFESLLPHLNPVHLEKGKMLLELLKKAPKYF